MKIGVVGVGFLVILLFGRISLASECDCTKIIGKCNGAIEFVKSFGSAPSYGAEIYVHSSEAQCSRVDYYVDSTPYQSYFNGSIKEFETLFGTKPISAKDVTYEACYLCTKVGSAPEVVSSSDAPVGIDFSGAWVYRERNIFGFVNSGPVNLVVKAGQISGSWDGKALSGTFDGVKGSVSISGGFSGMPLQVVDQNTIKYRFGAFGGGELVRQ